MKHLLSILIFFSFMSVANAYDEDKIIQAFLETGYRLVGTDILKENYYIVYHLEHKTDKSLLVSCRFSIYQGEETICYRP